MDGLLEALDVAVAVAVVLFLGFFTLGVFVLVAVADDSARIEVVLEGVDVRVDVAVGSRDDVPVAVGSPP